MKSMTRIEIETIATPLGDFTIAMRNGAVCLAEFSGEFTGDDGRIESNLRRRFGGVQLDTGDACNPSAPAAAVAHYFDGETTALDDITLDLAGSDFQRRVWRALCTIPLGETRSYTEIADAIGAPRACRAVGGANNRNPVAVIVPCHRVIGAGGGLTGYAGGLERKEWLLRHEGAI